MCHLISKKAKWSVACVPALALLLCGAYLLYLPLRAHYLFSRLEALEVSHSSFEDAQQIARKIGAKPGDPTRCDRSYCDWNVVVDNARLPQWWRGLGETFGINFVVRNSLLEYKGAWYAIGIAPYESTSSILSHGIDPYRMSPTYMVSAGIKETWLRFRPGDRIIEEPPTGAGWQVSYFEKNGSRELATAQFSARMTPRSPAADWRRYTAFNYSCLWKYKGCKDGVELLPTAGPIPPLSR